MNVAGALLVSAFDAAKKQLPDIHKKWVDAGMRIGGRAGPALLPGHIQQQGDVDVLLRAMEDETLSQHEVGGSLPFMLFHYQHVLSAYWIGAFYEILRVLKNRGQYKESTEFASIFKDFELLRIPLEKYEIAKDNKSPSPLEMEKHPPNGDQSDLYIYDPKDPNRSYTIPVCQSPRGSVMWHVIDLKQNRAYWIERRSLSERLINL